MTGLAWPGLGNPFDNLRRGPAVQIASNAESAREVAWRLRGGARLGLALPLPLPLASLLAQAWRWMTRDRMAAGGEAEAGEASIHSPLSSASACASAGAFPLDSIIRIAAQIFHFCIPTSYHPTNVSSTKWYRASTIRSSAYSPYKLSSPKQAVKRPGQPSFHPRCSPHRCSLRTSARHSPIATRISIFSLHNANHHALTITTSGKEAVWLWRILR